MNNTPTTQTDSNDPSASNNPNPNQLQPPPQPQPDQLDQLDQQLELESATGGGGGVVVGPRPTDEQRPSLVENCAEPTITTTATTANGTADQWVFMQKQTTKNDSKSSLVPSLKVSAASRIPPSIAYRQTSTQNWNCSVGFLECLFVSSP